MGSGAHYEVVQHASHLPDARALACAEDGRRELLHLWVDRGVPPQPQYGRTDVGPMATALDDEAGSLTQAQLDHSGAHS